MFSASSWWLFTIYTELHWRVLFGDNRAGIGREPLAILFKVLGELDLGYRLLAVAALAFNVWAFRSGRSRWLAIIAFLPTLVILSTVGMVQ